MSSGFYTNSRFLFRGTNPRGTNLRFLSSGTNPLVLFRGTNLRSDESAVFSQVNDNVKLIRAPSIRLPENTDNSLYKYKFDKLQQNGTIFCFEAFVKNKELLGDAKKGFFEVNLFHDFYEFSEKIGDTVLKLEFLFDTEIYNKSIDSSNNQKLVMNSYIHKRTETFGDIINEDWGWQGEITYPNPLGQTGVNFSLRIDIVDKTFNIIINEAIDHISYETPLPIWATEWIMVILQLKS
ncbi:unnamed protein product [Meloidogyne enterolobii]|uniref:Uncharacterized protein n=1 Tax=Meloidogyne enterolobii TaxID=390850 RepID=A0ACB0ZRD9_MELEN